MQTIHLKLLKALELSLIGLLPDSIDEEVASEARQQAVYSLICSQDQVLRFKAANIRLMYEQDQLKYVLRDFPYVILKGSAASFYYPDPFRRSLGDIDVLPIDYQGAKQALIDAGYKEDQDDDRHLTFLHNGTIIDLHKRFAVLQSQEQDALLDSWILKSPTKNATIGKYTFPIPSDQINGLVILAHISQHLEGGLGLRHLVDWCMYVKYSLSDAAWPSFREKTDQLGLTKLAKAVAKFGQMYLGLYKKVTWCSDVKEKTVNDLLEYVFACGNFGHAIREARSLLNQGALNLIIELYNTSHWAFLIITVCSNMLTVLYQIAGQSQRKVLFLNFQPYQLEHQQNDLKQWTKVYS